jgi:hypothetical protein
MRRPRVNRIKSAKIWRDTRRERRRIKKEQARHANQDDSKEGEISPRLGHGKLRVHSTTSPKLASQLYLEISAPQAVNSGVATPQTIKPESLRLGAPP